MLLGLDHLVVAVPELDTAIASYTELGFTVVRGGRHPVGTENALIAFADGSYIELIAFAERAEHLPWWHALQRGGGLVDFCMQTDDLRGDTAALRAAGVQIDDPSPLSRKRPDGYELRWEFSIPRDGGHRGVAPFLILDETSREERVPRQHAHANHVSGIGTLTVAVDDVPTVRRWYAEVLRAPGEEIQRGDLAASGVRFSVGPHELHFVAPKVAGGPLAEWIASRGALPFAATLATTGATGPLDPGKTLGARLALV
jgi:catechol 2,3-dioxygenase-like lactoylglutathione lyase family enzyme